MNAAVHELTWAGVALSFLPTAIVIAILYRWTAGAGTAFYATLRMLMQLLLIGYILVFIFSTERAAVIAGVLAVMLVAASWIAIRPVAEKSARLYVNALVAISAAGLLTLALVSQLVIGVEPWFSPRYVVPLAGMIFAAAMNTVSLAAERLQSELERGIDFSEARRSALQASLIPTVNSLFAVGLVSLPGMMTGQILSGISPMVAARYQIVVMSMLFGVSGIATTVFLLLQGRNERGRNR